MSDVCTQTPKVRKRPSPDLEMEFEVGEDNELTGRFRKWGSSEWQSKSRPKWWEFWRWGEFWPWPYID